MRNNDIKNTKICAAAQTEGCFYKTQSEVQENIKTTQSENVFEVSFQTNESRQYSTSPRRKRTRIVSLAQRSAANIRERRRMRSLNDAFDKLRDVIPPFLFENDLSRLETLRLASVYIEVLMASVEPQ